MKIEVTVPNGKSGDWEVSDFDVSESDARMFNMRAMFKPGGRTITPGKYKKLTRHGEIIMSNTPAEIRDHLSFIWTAKRGGDILINGLGLGVALSAILESKDVKSVTIIEKSPDVISLVAEHYLKDPRVTIVEDNAFDYKPPKSKRYAAVWHDIWDYICGDNLPEMTKLHRKYGKRTDWQGSWGRELCKR